MHKQRASVRLPPSRHLKPRPFDQLECNPTAPIINRSVRVESYDLRWRAKPSVDEDIPKKVRIRSCMAITESRAMRVAAVCIDERARIGETMG